MEIVRKVAIEADKGGSDAYWVVKVADLDAFTRNNVKYVGKPRNLLRDFFRRPHTFCEVEEPNLAIYNRLTPKGSDEYIGRINTVVQKNICGALSNPRVAADGRSINLELRPWGPHASRLRELLQSDITPVFAMRAMTDVDGNVDKVITWDLVG
ncbi:hypothetical protein STRATTON_136 [Erwinia phage vB_EamM_Stratton]|uniref:Virion structural protein n=2 Tax=Erskinevirus EaH2 TaxID=2169883 RepID=A0A1B2IH10_9CAUD|nr:head maturation protease [Erwinia phage phiEaH2]AFQ96585.1 hypothetical protein [Erwinia phage phiEaH2]ANZ50561.1 hypothetical protein STRATTON_136 [Erwinia phage vB_EamM_Stratton]